MWRNPIKRLNSALSHPHLFRFTLLKVVGSVAGPRARGKNLGSGTRMAVKESSTCKDFPDIKDPVSPLEGMENVYSLKIEGIMGGEGPARGWSVMRPSIRMGQNLSGYLTGP